MDKTIFIASFLVVAGLLGCAQTPTTTLAGNDKLEWERCIKDDWLATQSYDPIIRGNACETAVKAGPLYIAAVKQSRSNPSLNESTTEHPRGNNSAISAAPATSARADRSVMDVAILAAPNHPARADACVDIRVQNQGRPLHSRIAAQMKRVSFANKCDHPIAVLYLSCVQRDYLPLGAGRYGLMGNQKAQTLLIPSISKNQTTSIFFPLYVRAEVSDNEIASEGATSYEFMENMKIRYLAYKSPVVRLINGGTTWFADPPEGNQAFFAQEALSTFIRTSYIHDKRNGDHHRTPCSQVDLDGFWSRAKR